jgi:hypothetical protein
MLLSWRDVVEGLFEVKGREGEALLAVNLIDELPYRIRSNMGPKVFEQMPTGSFVITRLVPVGEEWLLSGAQALIPATSRTEIQKMATEFALKHPSLVFRNPRKLEVAWELQRKERGRFIEFFGSDLVVLPGHELAERMRAYMHFVVYEARDAEGRTAAERAKELGVTAKVPELKLPEHLREAETVGVIYDEVEGLNFYSDFGLVEETFARPELAAERKHRQAVLGYLKEPSISPLPLRRLAARDPDRAGRVFQQVLKQPRFSWQRDGEALLRRYKASYFARPALPSIVPVGNTLARGQLPAA